MPMICCPIEQELLPDFASIRGHITRNLWDCMYTLYTIFIKYKSFLKFHHLNFPHPSPKPKLPLLFRWTNGEIVSGEGWNTGCGSENKKKPVLANGTLFSIFYMGPQALKEVRKDLWRMGRGFSI